MSMMPTNKVNAGLAVGAVIVILTWAAKQFWKLELPVEIQAAMQTIGVAGVQWLVPDAKPDSEDPQA